MNRHPDGTLLSPRHSFADGTPPFSGVAMVAVVMIATACVTPSGAATLVEKGQARAVIILPVKPSPVVEGAARVLQDHISEMSGVGLPIRRENRITGSPSQDQM